jgi:hypothetical protein
MDTSTQGSVHASQYPRRRGGQAGQAFGGAQPHDQNPSRKGRASTRIGARKRKSRSGSASNRCLMRSPPIRTAASSSTRRFSTNSAGRPVNSVCRRFGDGFDPFAGGRRRATRRSHRCSPLGASRHQCDRRLGNLSEKELAFVGRRQGQSAGFPGPPPTFSCWPLRRANPLSRWPRSIVTGATAIRTPPTAIRRSILRTASITPAQSPATFRS